MEVAGRHANAPPAIPPPSPRPLPGLRPVQLPDRGAQVENPSGATGELIRMNDTAAESDMDIEGAMARHPELTRGG
jgi:hypothetical protein